MSTEFRVTLTTSEIRMAEEIGRGRTIESRRQGLKPVLENDSQEYDAEQQEYRDKLGSLGEIAVAKAFNVFFPGHVNTFKSIPDVYDWEVRTIDFCFSMRGHGRTGSNTASSSLLGERVL
jgi:hypothetical protein